MVTTPIASTRKSLNNTLGIPLIPLAPDTWLAAWPTRVKDFAAFVAATRYDATGNMLTLGKDDYDWLPHRHTWQSPGFAQTEDHPVVGVSYFDALEFCAWLTAQERAQKNIDDRQTYALPTDLEWSRAVGLGEEQGGSPEARLYLSAGTYPWGPEWPPPANFGNYARR